MDRANTFFSAFIFYLLIVFLFSGEKGFCQATFQVTIGGTGDDNNQSPYTDGCTQRTADGGYIVGGQTNSFGAGGYDIYLIKTDASGVIQWTKTYGGTGDEYARSVKQLSDGYIIVGSTTSFGQGAQDVYLIKTDLSGNLLWSKTYGGSGDDEGNYVTKTFDGGYIVTGLSYTYSAGYRDVYLIKTDSVGTMLWTKTYGGSREDDGRYVFQTADSGFMITGGSLSFGNGDNDVFLIKTNSAGVYQWSKDYNRISSSGHSDEGGESIQQTFDGGYIIAGNSNGCWYCPSTNEDLFLMKIDTAGNVKWATAYGGSDDDEDYFVQQTSDSGFIFTGYTKSFGAGGYDAYLVKTDSAGNYQWSKTFGDTSNDYGCAVQQATDGGYLVSGYTASFGSGNNDIYLIKTDANGNSACNFTNPPTTSYSLSIQVFNPSPSFSSGGSSTSPATVVDSGGILTKLCGIAPPLSVSILSQTNILCNGACNGTAVAKAFGGKTPYTYNWSSGAGSNTSVQGLCAGTYIITVTDSASNTAMDSVTITQPSLLVATAYSTPAKCDSANGTTAVITSGGTSPYTYNWNTTPVQTTQQVASLSAGNYAVTVSDAGNCTTTAAVTVGSSSRSAPGTITALRDTICSGTRGTLTLSGNSNKIIQWQSSVTQGNFTNIIGVIDTTEYTTLPLSQSAYYRVIVDSGGCSSVSDSILLFVPPVLTASFKFTKSGDTVTFNSDSSIGNIISYSWTFGDGTTGTAQNPVHIYNKVDTTYNVCLTIYDGSNCSYTFCEDVDLTTGISNVTSQFIIQLYPNPASNSLNLLVEGIEGNYQIKIYNVLGQLVGGIHESPLRGGNEIIPVSLNNLPSGAYELMLSNGNQYFRKQFVHLK